MERVNAPRGSLAQGPHLLAARARANRRDGVRYAAGGLPVIALYLVTLGFLFVCLQLTTMAEEGAIQTRKVGGIRFVKVGRFGCSFYVSKGAK